MKLNKLGLIALGMTTLASCDTAKKATAETKKEIHGIDLSYMDTLVKPGDDFFRYVNGTWFDNTEIPADRTRWGSFDELRKNTDEDVKVILEEAIKSGKYDSDTDQGKAISYYKTIMDTVTRDKNGIEPLKPYLEKIEAVKNTTDLQNLLAEMQQEGGGMGFFGVGV